VECTSRGPDGPIIDRLTTKALYRVVNTFNTGSNIEYSSTTSEEISEPALEKRRAAVTGRSQPGRGL